MTPRFWSLVLKELRQIRRDKRLVLSLIIPPVVELERAIPAVSISVWWCPTSSPASSAAARRRTCGINQWCQRQHRSARPGHVQAAVAWLNQKPGVVEPVELKTALLYNPGLDNTWFTVTACWAP